MYLVHTRLDLAYTLSIVSQFVHKPREQHMNADIRILCYLKASLWKGILFIKNTNYQCIDSYTYVDWVGAIDDRQSTFDYFTVVGDNLITWRSKKQNVVACSIMEAEFKGMPLGICEELWLRLLL